MAVVGGALLDKFIGTSEAEKAFQPWWDTVEDFLVYGLIMLGNLCFQIAILFLIIKSLRASLIEQCQLKANHF